MMQRKWMLTTLGAGAAAALAVPEVRYLRRLGEISQSIREVRPPTDETAADDARPQVARPG